MGRSRVPSPTLACTRLRLHNLGCPALLQPRVVRLLWRLDLDNLHCGCMLQPLPGHRACQHTLAGHILHR